MGDELRKNKKEYLFNDAIYKYDRVSRKGKINHNTHSKKQDFSEKMKKDWRGSSKSCQDAYGKVIIMNCRR